MVIFIERKGGTRGKEGRKEINACTSLTRQNSSRFGRGTVRDARKFPPASSDSRKGRQVMLAVVEECTERRPRWRAAPFTRISCNYYRVAALFLPARDQSADTHFASVIPLVIPKNVIKRRLPNPLKGRVTPLEWPTTSSLRKENFAKETLRKIPLKFPFATNEILSGTVNINPTSSNKRLAETTRGRRIHDVVNLAPFTLDKLYTYIPLTHRGGVFREEWTFLWPRTKSAARFRGAGKYLCPWMNGWMDGWKPGKSFFRCN